jgi:hypothetical protein
MRETTLGILEMKFVPLLAAALLLTGCSTIKKYTPDVRFAVLEPSQKKAEEPEIDEAALIKDPVLRANRMEIGALYDGYMLAVFGEAPTTGWFAPELRPRNNGAASADGMLELDFVAAPPEKNDGEPGTEGTPVQRAIRADYQITRRALVGMRGVRIYAASGPIQGLF